MEALDETVASHFKPDRPLRFPLQEVATLGGWQGGRVALEKSTRDQAGHVLVVTCGQVVVPKLEGP